MLLILREGSALFLGQGFPPLIECHQAWLASLLFRHHRRHWSNRAKSTNRGWMRHIKVIQLGNVFFPISLGHLPFHLRHCFHLFFKYGKQFIGNCNHSISNSGQVFNLPAWNLNYPSSISAPESLSLSCLMCTKFFLTCLSHLAPHAVSFLTLSPV